MKNKIDRQTPSYFIIVAALCACLFVGWMSYTPVEVIDTGDKYLENFGFVKSKKLQRDVIIHFSKSNYGNASEVCRWHVGHNRWPTIGYHFVILNGNVTRSYSDKDFDGSVETGKGLNERGRHCRWHNDTIGICFISKNGEITRKQYGSLKKLLIKLSVMYRDIKVYFHNDFNKKKPRLKSEWRKV